MAETLQKPLDTKKQAGPAKKAFWSPITRRRYHRFRRFKRAWYSLIFMVMLYIISLLANFLANELPLYVKFEGNSYYPAFRGLFGKIYPDDTFTGSGLNTRPDYKAINKTTAFTEEDANWMLWPPIPFGPHEIIKEDDVELPKEVKVTFVPQPKVGTVDLREDLSISRAQSSTWFLGTESDRDSRKLTFTDKLTLPPAIRTGLNARFSNQESPVVNATIPGPENKTINLELPPYKPRSRAPATVRLTMREATDDATREWLELDASYTILDGESMLWEGLSEADRKQITDGIDAQWSELIPESRYLDINGSPYEIRFEREVWAKPFRPISLHIMGLDSSGRDVFTRILYGMRIALNFGLLLVVISIFLGIIIGAVQGYTGGLTDITAQRFIEIWSAMPFLYVVIFLGSVFGRSFMLLLVCYAIFSWIGLSYYMRAEFLKLRGLQYVEAARLLGLPSYIIIFRHMLPNALMPVITLFPFMLVGAIGVLTSLDYLGYGLPPGTPSWGELFNQAQEYKDAWWLVLFPFIALTTVLMLCTFIGEGLREAFDPKQYSRLK